MERLVEYKMGGILKDVDVEKRIITGYYTAAELEDSDKDIFLKNCFKKTIDEVGPKGANRVWHLYNHNVNMPVNKPYVLQEDSKGAYFEVKLLKHPICETLLELYQEGALTEHSVCYQVVKSTSKDGIRLISEAKLWEGSSVLWGAQSQTPFTGFKSSIHERATSLVELFQSGIIELDEFKELVLMELKKIKTALEPPVDQALKPQQWIDFRGVKLII